MHVLAGPNGRAVGLLQDLSRECGEGGMAVRLLSLSTGFGQVLPFSAKNHKGKPGRGG